MKDKTEWVTIGYEIRKEIFDKYGLKPFQIMKKKMRNGKGKVWNNINFFDAKKEAEKAGFRLFGIREAMLLLDAYKEQGKDISVYDKKFLGIEELSYDEYVAFEWIELNEKIAFLRGGPWGIGANAGSFALALTYTPSLSSPNIGFRCCRKIQKKIKKEKLRRLLWE